MAKNKDKKSDITFFVMSPCVTFDSNLLGAILIL
jgi:hypothetical protein